MRPFRTLVKVLQKIESSPLTKVFMAFIIVVLIGSYLEFLTQRNVKYSEIKNYFTAIWFTMETVTTVGYGDVVPVSNLGRVVAMLIMVSGIGLLGTLTATISAYLFQIRIERRGKLEKRLKNHTIICNWNAYTRNIIEGNRDEEAAPIVILSENTDNSEKYQNVFFVKGDCTSEDDLKNAAIEDAARVVIMSDIENNAIPEDLLDAKTLLSIFTVRKLNNAVEIIAEVRDEKNKKHAVSAGATEVLSVGELSSRLISRSISNPGLTDFILKSLSETEDFKIFSIEACGILPGMTVKDAASNLAEVCVIISVISKGKIEYPPDRSYKIGAGDYVVFLAKNKKEVEEAIKG